MELLSQADFHKLAQAETDRPTDVGIYKPNLNGQPVQLNDSRVFRFCFSDGEVDHQGDTLNPKGWVLDDFNLNPVALWSHDVKLPIGRASNLAVEGNRLMGDIEFASVDVSPFADEIYRLVKAGFVKACSVGFFPLAYEF